MKIWPHILIACVLGLLWIEAGAASRSPESVRAAHGADLSNIFLRAKEQSAKLQGRVAQRSSSLAQQISGVAFCGDSFLDTGEQCDDGNGTSGDGCSSDCQIENGWMCTNPIPPNPTNLVLDPGFEAGPMGGVWAESSTNFDTLICDSGCGLSGQRSGDFWVWFGGIDASTEEGEMSQSFSIPATATELRFWIAAPSCGENDDFIEVLLDSTPVWTMTGTDPACNDATYMEQLVDITAWADDAVHELTFHSIVSTPPNEFTDFYLDDVFLAHGPISAIPSECTNTQPEFIFSHGFEDPQ